MYDSTSSFTNTANLNCWSQIYRPQAIDELILPDDLTGTFNKIKESESTFPPLLFYGSPGAGKTTAARLLGSSDNTFYINCSKLGTTKKLAGLSSHGSTLMGDKKLVILDEADGMSEKAQYAIRGISEEVASTTSFIMIANFPKKLIAPIKSRFNPISFNFAKDKSIVSNLIDRIKSICETENLTAPDDAIIKSLIDRYYPDTRKILDQVEWEVKYM